MNKRIIQWKSAIEWQAFGVCTAIGERMGLATSRIRMWFIYISFLTLGSPLIIYMVLAFWMNMKRYILMRPEESAALALDSIADVLYKFCHS